MQFKEEIILKQNGSIFFLLFGKLIAMIILSITVSSCTLKPSLSDMLRNLQGEEKGK